MLLLIRLATLLLVLFLIAGCSSDDGAVDEPTAAAAATTESTTTTAATTTTTTTEPTEPNRLDEIEALIEAYLASWETEDEQALHASVADDFILNEYIYSSQGRLDRHRADADGVVRDGFGEKWQNEVVGEPIVTGDGPWTVAYRELWQ